ncbi:MAG: hypothetical protein PHR03_05240 [Desulfovibrionales bacterium]|nr:hypothetical protein [Desulfovibrionales bacterium]
MFPEKKYLLGGVVCLLFCILSSLSCSPRLTLAEAELKYGPHPPVVERFYCPAIIRSGDTLKFYISAKDEDRDLAYIHVNVRQRGAGEESVPYMKVHKDNRAQVAGYLYMLTPPAILFGETINVAVAVIDQAGHHSGDVSQDIYFGNESLPDCPPGWARECNNPLGFIPVFLRPFQERSTLISPRTM